jgi:hydroxymethylglutaryl-CoA lyase
MSVDVMVREVGTRDGLQSIDHELSTADKVLWCQMEAKTGVPEIEVSSFVSPRAIPQLADAADVVGDALQIDGLRVAVLVPNLRGAERAFEIGAHKVNYVLSVSESHNKRNVNRTVDESFAAFAEISARRAELPAERRPILNGYLSTAFGCTIEGAVSADSVGYANPAAIKRVFRAVGRAVGDIPLVGHFHDTRGLGLANVTAALEADVRAFDASLGGFGGCPFAPGATGNVDMEDLVFMLEAMGLRTGVDIEALLSVREWLVDSLPDVRFHGAIPVAGLPKNFSLNS